MYNHNFIAELVSIQYIETLKAVSQDFSTTYDIKYTIATRCYSKNPEKNLNQHIVVCQNEEC